MLPISLSVLYTLGIADKCTWVHGNGDNPFIAIASRELACKHGVTLQGFRG